MEDWAPKVHALLEIKQDEKEEEEENEDVEEEDLRVADQNTPNTDHDSRTDVVVEEVKTEYGN